MAKRIFFIRHGETELNALDAVDGRSDSGLNGNGRRQAVALKDYLFSTFPQVFDTTLTRLVGSPSRRAVETASYIFPDIECRTDPGFMEVDVGAVQGVRWRDALDETMLRLEHGVHDQFPGGESFSEAQRRAALALSIHLGEAPPNLVVVAHGGVISLMLLHSMGLAIEAFPFTEIANCSCSVVEVFEIEGRLFPKIKMLNYLPC